MTAPTPQWPGPQWTNPTPPRQRPLVPWLIGAAVAVLVLAGILVFVLSRLATTDLHGEVVGTGSTAALLGSSGFYPTVAGDCAGHGDYDDIRGGAVVTVLDSTGRIVGTTQLRSGTGTYGSCTFGFDVLRLPPSEFYQVSVSGRPAVTWTLDEVMGEGGIRMTVGS